MRPLAAARFAAAVRIPTGAPSPRAEVRLLTELGLAALRCSSAAKKKHKKKKCAKAGQPTSKKRKKCCAGLGKDEAGRCGTPSSSSLLASGCTPTTCPAGTCGDLPDGCGGTLSCGSCAG